MRPCRQTIRHGDLSSPRDSSISASVTADSLAEARKQGAVLAWGNFVTVAINFLIVAAVLFFVVKLINRLKRQEAAKEPAAPPRQEVLLAEIRDLLKKG